MFDFEVLLQSVEQLKGLVNTQALIIRSNVFEYNKFDPVNLNKFVNTARGQALIRVRYS